MCRSTYAAPAALSLAVVLAAYGNQSQSREQDLYRQQQYGQPQYVQIQPQPRTRHDRNRQLERQIADRLGQAGLGGQGQIMLLAVGNEVILLGTVPDQNRSQRAEQITRQIPGVQQVDNRLHVPRETRHVEDTQLRQSIQQQLPGRLAQTIRVQVEDGQVTLDGQVDNWHAMADAIEAAFAAGAQQVNSQLSVAQQSPMPRDQQDGQDEPRGDVPAYGYVPGQENQRQMPPGRVRIGTTPADVQLAQQVARQLRRQWPDQNLQTLTRAGIYIAASQGTVTLLGTVEDRDQIRQIERIARGIRGVQDVQNNLTAAADSTALGHIPREDQEQIQPQDQADTPQARPGTGYQARDMRLEQRIASTLRQQGYGERGEIMVLAAENRVILLGTVPDQRTKSGTEQAVRQMAAGQTVDNRLHVVARPGRIPDSQLARTVADRLPGHLRQNVRVQARNGVVTLQGRVDNWRQAADAIDAAFAAGAIQVNSQFTVRGTAPTARDEPGDDDQQPGTRRFDDDRF